MAALEKRDAERAQALMRAHLDAGREAATLS